MPSGSSSAASESTNKHSNLRRLELLDAPLLAVARGRVLEVGCGAGRLLRKLVGRANLVAGIDRHAPVLDIAALVLPGRIARADAVALPFRDGSFDSILAGYHAFATLEWGPSFLEMGRLLVPGGVLAFSCWTAFGQWMGRWKEALLEGRRPTDDPEAPVLSLFRTQSHLDRLLRPAGLVTEAVWGLPILGPLRRWTGPIVVRPGPLAFLCMEVIVTARKR